MYVYVRSKFENLFTVGHYAPDGSWHPDTDFDNSDDAAGRCNYLNGGKLQMIPIDELAIARIGFTQIDILLDIENARMKAIKEARRGASDERDGVAYRELLRDLKQQSLIIDQLHIMKDSYLSAINLHSKK